MHIVISNLPFAAFVLVTCAADHWHSRRPAARARWAALSLREKITRTIRLRRVAVALQAGYLALFTGLYLAGLLPFASWTAITVTVIVTLAAHLYLYRAALAARRAYDGLGPMAYIAEVRHAFGPAPGNDR